MTRVEALNAAGKLEEAWALFGGTGLYFALFRLQYAHEGLELMQPYFPRSWEQGPILRSEVEDTELLLLHAAAFLHEAANFELACKLFTRVIKMGLEKGTERTIVALGNLIISSEEKGQRARAERVQNLAIRLAEADGTRNSLLWLRCNQAYDRILRGRLAEAEAILVTLRQAIKTEDTRPERETQIRRCDVAFAFRTGCLSETIDEDHLKRARSLGQPRHERLILNTVACWRQAHGRHEEALDAFGNSIALANDFGARDLPAYEARRAVSLAALGRQDEVRRVANKVRGKNLPHVPLALLYVELGDQTRAPSPPTRLLATRRPGVKARPISLRRSDVRRLPQGACRRRRAGAGAAALRSR